LWDIRVGLLVRRTVATLDPLVTRSSRVDTLTVELYPDLHELDPMNAATFLA